MTEARLSQILETIRLNSNKRCVFKRMRHDLEALAKLFPPDPTAACEPVRIGKVMAEWIYDPRQNPDTTILYLHGGGFVMGSVRSHRGMGHGIARASEAKLLMLDYRLAPEHPFPAALEDTVNAYEKLLEWKRDPRKIVVAGDSAGGNLAISSLIALRDKGVPMPAAIVMISPWLDLKLTGRSMKENAAKDSIVRGERLEEKVSAYLGDTDPANPLVSPILADLRGLPPMLIQVGSTEVLLDDSKNLEKKALADKVEVDLRVWENMVHAWPFFAPILPEGEQAMEQIGRFIGSRVK